MKVSEIRFLAVLVVALGIGGAAAQPENDDGSGAGTKIMALENVWNNAEKARDTAALDLILDNEMVYIDEDGSVLTKVQFLEHAKQTGPQLQTLVTSGVNVHVYGQTALASGTYRVSGVTRGRPFQRQGRFIDTWVLKNGSWVCVAAQSTPVVR